MKFLKCCYIKPKPGSSCNHCWTDFLYFLYVRKECFPNPSFSNGDCLQITYKIKHRTSVSVSAAARWKKSDRVRGNEIANNLARSGSVQWFVGPEPFLGSLGRLKEERWNAGWRNSIWHCGVVPVEHRQRLENWSLALIWLQGPDYCPLTGHNPGLLSAYSLDITPWEDIYV